MRVRKPFRMIIQPLCWKTTYYLMFVFNRQILFKYEKHGKWKERKGWKKTGNDQAVGFTLTGFGRSETPLRHLALMLQST